MSERGDTAKNDIPRSQEVSRSNTVSKDIEDMKDTGNSTPDTKETVYSAPRISQPNSLWNPRMLTVNNKRIAYKFGEGNPTEVALVGDALKSHWKAGGKGYMTAEAEKALKTFLDNPSLPYFIEKCYKQINWYHQGENVQEWNKFPNDLSMENLMYVDPETGRKEFKYDTMITIAGAFNSMDNRLEEDVSKRLWSQCLSQVEYVQHFQTLDSQFQAVWKNYGNQWNVR
ncbi:MAG: hypothetical protein ACOYN2_04080 [Patescibacteria group bacterium]